MSSEEIAPAISGPALREALETKALSLGFSRLGVARAVALEEDATWLRKWLSEGKHGSMGYMADTAAVRSDPNHAGMLPSAASVIVLATAYARPPGALTGPWPGVVASYARGRDYHNVIGKKMRKLARLLKELGHVARASVDTLPILERAWAQRSGLGFIGKNACLIIPGLGSHVLLSCLVTSAQLPFDEPMKQRCGTCERCLKSCPTDAFTAPRELDARRCISYLTIEHRGALDPDLQEKMGNHIFGCDDCQDSCPFNRTAPPSVDTTLPFEADGRLATDAAELLQMDEERYLSWAQGSPMRRPGREGMARNAAIVLGNHRDPHLHLPILQQAAEHHDLPVVREAASWALDRLNTKASDLPDHDSLSDPGDLT